MALSILLTCVVSVGWAQVAAEPVNEDKPQERSLPNWQMSRSAASSFGPISNGETVGAPNASDFMEVPVLHSFLMDSPEVQRSVVNFLRTSKFH